MSSTLAELYLLRALKMKSKREKENAERVRNGICIIEGCSCKVRSRGLCDKHRQLWYLEFRSRKTPQEQAEFETDCVKQGLILVNGEQEKILRKVRNPFASAG